MKNNTNEKNQVNEAQVEAPVEEKKTEEQVPETPEDSKIVEVKKGFVHRKLDERYEKKVKKAEAKAAKAAEPKEPINKKKVLIGAVIGAGVAAKIAFSVASKIASNNLDTPCLVEGNSEPVMIAQEATSVEPEITESET